MEVCLEFTVAYWDRVTGRCMFSALTGLEFTVFTDFVPRFLCEATFYSNTFRVFYVSLFLMSNEMYHLRTTHNLNTYLS